MSVEARDEGKAGTTDDEQDWSKSCPICFVEGVSLARSPSCNHAFCLDCMKQFFSLPEEPTEVESEAGSPDDTANENDPERLLTSITSLLLENLKDRNIDDIGTIGRCPLCRYPMSLLTMMHLETGRPVWEEGRFTRLEDTPLAGKVFATRKGVGWNSFHFPSRSNTTGTGPTDTDSERTDEDWVQIGHNSPYLLWQNDKSLYPHPPSQTSNHQDDDTTSPTKHYLTDCLYFAPKQTLCGTVSLPDAHGNPQRHDILLNFSTNHSWITGGVMVRHKSQPPKTVSQSADDRHSYFPLEGRWMVTWYRQQLPPGTCLETVDSDLVLNTDYIDVKDNFIHDAASMEYMLLYEKDRIYFHWTGFGVTQTLDPDSDFRRKDDRDALQEGTIPAVGDYLRWTTTHQQQPYIVWKRESIEDPPSGSDSQPHVEYFGRSGGEVSRRLNTLRLDFHDSSPTWYREWLPSSANGMQEGNQGGTARPRYVADRLWGNTFCQGLQVGLASYHFGMRATPLNQQEQQQEMDQACFAYISYESDACSRWPPLDDGSPIPPQVYFHNISLEQAEGSDGTTSHSVFRGTIEWLQDYGTTWQNHERWEYEMHFDSEFTCIMSGAVHCTTASTPTSPSTRHEMSQYGSDLVYINAGIIEAFDTWMGGNRNDVDDGGGSIVAGRGTVASIQTEVYQRYTDLSRSLRRRLHSEGASVRTVAMLNTVLTRSQQPGSESPINYNL